MKAVATLYRKELLEMSRDRRTLISMVLVPVIAMPLLFKVMHVVMSSSEKKAEEEGVTVALPEHLAMPGLEDALKNAGLTLVTKPDPRAAVEKKDSAAALIEEKSPAGAPMLRIFVDRSRRASEKATNKIESALDTLKESKVKEALAAKGISDAVLDPFSVEDTDVAPKGKQGGNMLGGLIGYMVILLMFSGCMYPSLDMTAGEKERRTLEILLASPARREDVVLSKVLAASTAAFITALLNIMSLAWVFTSGKVGKDIDEMMVGVHVNATAIALVLCAVLPTAVTAAAVMITIASFAKSFKEGQSSLTPVIMLVVFPAVIGMLPGMDENPSLALLPVFNVSQLIKAIFAGTYNAAGFAMSFCSNLVYATVAFVIAVRIFKREDVLFRS